MSTTSPQVVILAGGLGTRLSEETSLRPKPMVEIAGMPILWHIMKSYSHFGFNNFIVCLGYKGYMIKEYFYNYFLHASDLKVSLADNQMSFLNSRAEPWTIQLIDTGPSTQTGGRIKRIEPYITGEHFMLTYGDGVSDINIRDAYDFHHSHDAHATVTAVQLAGRFGALQLEEDHETVSSFVEKPRGDGAWINGGFFVLDRKVFDYIGEDEGEIWEKTPLEKLAKDGQLRAFKHKGFWKPMDTLRDNIELNQMVTNGTAPWMLWEK